MAVSATQVPVDTTFEAFYGANVDRVHRALALTIGDPDLARDATDEAMARAYTRWATVGHLGNPAGWVYRVGLNWARSRWRKLRRERPMAEWRAVPVPPPDADAAAASAALTTLPTDQRAAVVCRILLDLSTAETAAVLGVPEGTVRSRLSRALAVLRAHLAEEQS